MTAVGIRPRWLAQWCGRPRLQELRSSGSGCGLRCTLRRRALACGGWAALACLPECRADMPQGFAQRRIPGVGSAVNSDASNQHILWTYQDATMRCNQRSCCGHTLPCPAHCLPCPALRPHCEPAAAVIHLAEWAATRLSGVCAWVRARLFACVSVRACVRAWVLGSDG